MRLARPRRAIPLWREKNEQLMLVGPSLGSQPFKIASNLVGLFGSAYFIFNEDQNIFSVIPYRDIDLSAFGQRQIAERACSAYPKNSVGRPTPDRACHSDRGGRRGTGCGTLLPGTRIRGNGLGCDVALRRACAAVLPPNRRAAWQMPPRLAAHPSQFLFCA